MNRKDAAGKNVFQGGFLGLDNIGVFDRSKALPAGGRLEQADATSWMAMYCLNLLEIALELARENKSYQDVANKFLEHRARCEVAAAKPALVGIWPRSAIAHHARVAACDSLSTMETVLGRFELVAKVAWGAMGVVYQGIDRETRVPVAIKLLRSGMRGGRVRFDREVASFRASTTLASCATSRTVTPPRGRCSSWSGSKERICRGASTRG